MIRTTDGDYLLGGFSLSSRSGEVSESNRTKLSGKKGTGADYWIVKIGGRTGYKLWDKRFGGRTDEKGANDELSAVFQTPGGDYLLAGHSETAKGFEKSEDSRGKTDYWIVKATPETATVSSFTLVNADTDEDIGEIKEGDVINLAALPITRLNVRANTDPATVGSVLFSLRGQQTRDHVENNAPYALFANNGQDYLSWTPEPVSGDYTLTATPYSAPAAGGAKGRAYRVAFRLIKCTPDVVNLVLEHEATIPGGNAALREGEAIDIVIKLRNTGEHGANEVQVQVDALTGCSGTDPEITFHQVTPGDGTCNPTTGIWEISLLNGCSEAELVIAGVKRSNAGVINSAARIQDGSTASSIRLDVVEEGEENSSAARFQIDIKAPGEMVEETSEPVDIDVTNGGPRTAKNVRLTYTVTAIIEGEDPDTLTSGSQSFGDLSPGCQIPTINFDVALSRPGTIRINVNVSSDNGGGGETKEITVTVTPGDPDATPVPNDGSSAARRANETNDEWAGPRLYPSYPNPFRAATTIAFRLVK